MKNTFATIIEKADDLFASASYISHIKNKRDYRRALKLMDVLIEDYEHNRPLIDILSLSISRWENTAAEFSEFNKRIENIDSAEAILKVLMEQYSLGIADFPEIGSKSLVSKILHGERRLTRDHIDAISKRFGIEPGLFF